MVLALGCLPLRLPAATFTVTTTGDSGPGSFREAILNSNAAGDLDTIQFLIPGTGPFSIAPISPLPPLGAPVVVDATTQPGYANQPLVELNGTGAGLGTVGLRVTGGDCTIRGLAINRFNADGIRLDSSNNRIQGNRIGTDVTGTSTLGNGQFGIFVLGTATNVIGGTTAAERNVIAGRNDTGIYLLNARANVIQGNYIGLNAAGTAALGNTNNGIVLFNASANLIGGTVTGARNVIAGNGGSGINLNTAGATGNVIQGNYIGVNAAGTGALSNRADGITLNDAPANLIGGTNAGAGNLLSGNGQSGLYLNGAGARSNLIAGNLIGLNATGAAALGNAFAGVTFSGATDNRLGLAEAGARNVISGNRLEGVFLAANSTSNRVQGNFIGPAANGTSALGNGASGVALNNAADNLIGGGEPGAGNLISGNGQLGVWLLNSNASGNRVQGNLIGTAVGGAAGLGNVNAGVGLTDAPGNTIGGLTPGEQNVISANGFPANNGGIFILGAGAQGNQFLGNLIGTDRLGQVALANRYEGIYIINAGSNRIGSELAGGGNLISGNTTRGIRITNSVGGVIRGNLIGTKLDGTSSLANGQFNVEIEENSNAHELGGLAVGAGNRIAFSGSGLAGIRVRDLTLNNAILGNLVFSNSGLGLDLSAAGVTGNDSCDLDAGGNLRQNFPVLTQAYSSGNLGVRGTLESAPNTTFRLQFFASPACDAAGNGEGATFLGDQLVTTGPTCATDFVVTLPASVALGQVITATATDPANNTSEFSACRTVLSPPRLTLSPPSNGQIALAWTNTAPGFVLKETANLTPPVVWSTVTNVPVTLNGQFVVTLPRVDANRFYQLNFE